MISWRTVLAARRLDRFRVQGALRHAALGHPLAQHRQRGGSVRLIRGRMTIPSGPRSISVLVPRKS